MSVKTTVRVIVVTGVLGFYAPALAELSKVWWTDDYATQGLFAPLFSVLLLWIDRDRLRATFDGHGSGLGIPVAALGLGFLALGRSMDSLAVQAGSFVVTVAGVTLWGCGTRCLRAAAFPVGFLVFMVPPPQAAIGAVTLQLQLFAAGFAAAILRLFDVPVYQSGVLIELPTMRLEVAEICNGLRFLLALLVLTAAFAQVTQRTRLRKVALVASAVPIAILANAVRVAVIALGVYYVGPQVAGGFVHHTIGKVVWALTLLPLAAIGLLLARRGRTSSPSSEADLRLAKGKEGMA